MKSLLKTKTFWGGIASIAGGIGMIIAGETSGGTQMIVIGVLAILGRDAVRKAEIK